MEMDLSYMKLPLRKADWLLQCKDGSSTGGLLPCYSAILCSASPVLYGLDEEIRPGKDGKTVIPFPGSEKEARALLSWLYNQQRPLAHDEIISLANISHEWNMEGTETSQPHTANYLGPLHPVSLHSSFNLGIHTCCVGLASTCDAFLSQNRSTFLKIPSQAEKTPPAQDCLDWALLADKCGLTKFWDYSKKFIVLHSEVISLIAAKTCPT